MKDEGKEAWVVEVALRGELKKLALVLLDALDFQDCPISLIGEKLEALAEWLPVVQSEDFVEAFWGKIQAVATSSHSRAVKSNLEDRHILGALKSANDLAQFLERFAILLGEIPPEEEEAAEEVAAVGEGTSLTVLFPTLSIRASNALYRSKHLAEEIGIPEDDPRRRPTVEDVLEILKSGAKGMNGEDFLLSSYVRSFGPKALKGLKTALREHGFLPDEEE